MTKLKKYLYWLSFPLCCILFMVFEMLRHFSEFIVDGLHKYEAWMMEYKRRFPHMHYKGDGIYSSYKGKSE